MYRAVLWLSQDDEREEQESSRNPIQLYQQIPGLSSVTDFQNQTGNINMSYNQWKIEKFQQTNNSTLCSANIVVIVKISELNAVWF